MDVEGRRNFWSAIRKDAEQGRTVLFATHYLEEADAYADRIVLLRHGRDRRRRHRRRDQVDGGRPDRARDPRRTQPRRSLRGDSRRGLGSRSAATPCSSTANDSDAVARYLLTQTAAKDLEITARGIEDAFIALTGDDRCTSAASTEQR